MLCVIMWLQSLVLLFVWFFVTAKFVEGSSLEKKEQLIATGQEFVCADSNENMKRNVNTLVLSDVSVPLNCDGFDY